MSVVVAFMLDLFIGDPQSLIFMHPVVLFGRLITSLELVLYPRNSAGLLRKACGALLVLLVCTITYSTTVLLLKASGPLKGLLTVWLISTALAARGLRNAAMKVYNALKSDDLTMARMKVGEIVGRDTHDLCHKEVIRATVESVSESSVDGVTAPLFYAFVGGPPLALLYKAVNTMDSMIGHRDERYKDFGWAAARLDDLLNYIPARISAVCLLLGVSVLRLDWRQSFQSMASDSHKHNSPNSGIPEAGVAGALGIQLGGSNYYQGDRVESPRLGVKKRELSLDDIRLSVSIMLAMGVIFLLLGYAAISLLGGWSW